MPTRFIRRAARSAFIRLGLLVGMAAAPAFAAEPAPTRAADQENPVRMRPFKVFAEWMEIQPLLKRGVIETVRIAQVQPGSPAAAAGLKAGMRVVEFQGISVVGLSEAEFIRRMDALPASDRINVKVLGITTQRASEFSVPISGPAIVKDAPPAAAKTQEKPRAATLSVVNAAMTEAETRALIETLRRSMESEMMRVREEARATGRAQTDPNLMMESVRALGRTPPSHLAVLCEMAAKTGSDSGGSMLRAALTGAMTGRSDYAPEQKAVVLHYLPKLPELIGILDRMKWFEGTQAALAAGWKKARQDERDGMLTSRGSRYARLAAKQGLTDALVGLAQTVRNPAAGQAHAVEPPQRGDRNIESARAGGRRRADGAGGLRGEEQEPVGVRSGAGSLRVEKVARDVRPRPAA